MGRAQSADWNTAVCGNVEIGPTGTPNATAENPGPLRFDENPLGFARRSGNDITTLVLAKPRRNGALRQPQARAHPACHGHFGNRNKQPAIGYIVNGVNPALFDQRADKIAVALFGRQIDRRGSALFPALDLAQIERLAEMALRFADHENGIARA